MRKTVKLDTGLTALAEPAFVVKANDAYYLCVAVLEYKPDDAKDDARKEEGVAQIARMFEQGMKGGCFEACEIPSGSSGGGQYPGEPDKTYPAEPVEPTPMPAPPPPPAPPGVQTEPPGVQTEPPGVQTSP